jgi:hypothetical protein
MDVSSNKEIEIQLTSSPAPLPISPAEEQILSKNSSIIIKQLDIAEGLKELLITHNLLSLESILNMSPADLANTLGIDQHVCEIIRIAVKKQIKTFEQMQ